MDLRGAKATNLLPDTSPQDIYREVADELINEVEQDKENGNRFAGEWLALPITRDICWMTVMTTPHWVTDYGIKLQLRKEDFTAKLEKHGCSPITAQQVQRGKQFINKLARHSDPIPDYLWILSDTGET